jgi:hypothetical protein
MFPVGSGATEGVHDLHIHSGSAADVRRGFGSLDRFVQSHWVHEVLCAMQTSQDYAGCFATLFGDH